jgi:uncharacterized membrane protein
MSLRKPSPLALGLSIGLLSGITTIIVMNVLGFSDAFVAGDISTRRLTAIWFAIATCLFVVIGIVWLVGSNYLERNQKLRDQERADIGNDQW